MRHGGEQGPEELLAVLRETRRLLSRPDNRMGWSWWSDVGEALREFDDAVRAGAWGRLRGLYAPAGPLQDVSISSGWAEEFLDVSARFDAAVAKADPPAV